MKKNKAIGIAIVIAIIIAVVIYFTQTERFSGSYKADNGLYIKIVDSDTPGYKTLYMHDNKDILDKLPDLVHSRITRGDIPPFADPLYSGAYYGTGPYRNGEMNFTMMFSPDNISMIAKYDSSKDQFVTYTTSDVIYGKTQTGTIRNVFVNTVITAPDGTTTEVFKTDGTRVVPVEKTPFEQFLFKWLGVGQIS